MIAGSALKNIAWEPGSAREVHAVWRSQRKLWKTQKTVMRISENIAVVDFDEIPAAATSKPPLATIRQPIQPTGSPAAEWWIDIIEHPAGQPRRVLLPTELIIRSSWRTCLVLSKGGDIPPIIQTGLETPAQPNPTSDSYKGEEHA